MNDIVYLGSIYGKFKQGYDGSVYSAEGILPTMLTNSISNNKMYVLVEEEENESRDISSGVFSQSDNLNKK